VRHLPNLICVIRLLLVWPIVRALHAGADLAALVVFIAAAVADKLLLIAVFVECAWLGLVPWWLTAAVVARDVMIGLGALIFWLWFGPLRGRPTAISKVNTATQLLYVMLVLLHGAAGAAGVPPQEILDACALLTLATTVLSGVHYILTFTRRAWTQPARTA
jgi:cardiolipin synthase